MAKRINFELTSVFFNGKWYTPQEWTDHQKKATQTQPPIISKYPNFKATLKDKAPTVDTYIVNGTDGMTDTEIITACDPHNFGGQVYGNICKVYID